MESVFHIGRAAEQLGVSAQYLRRLEWQGRVPPARRDLRGRVYTASDIALLRSIGVGSGRRLKHPEQALEAAG